MNGPPRRGIRTDAKESGALSREERATAAAEAVKQVVATLRTQTGERSKRRDEY